MSKVMTIEWVENGWIVTKPTLLGKKQTVYLEMTALLNKVLRDMSNCLPGERVEVIRP